MLIESVLFCAIIGLVFGQDEILSGFTCASNPLYAQDCDKVKQSCPFKSSTYAGYCCVSGSSIYDLNSGSPTTLVGGFPGGRCLDSTSTFNCNLIDSLHILIPYNEWCVEVKTGSFPNSDSTCGIVNIPQRQAEYDSRIGDKTISS